MTRARDLANIADGTFTATDLDLSGTLTVSGDANFDSGTLFVDVSANNVGIGTTSPSSALDVVGGVEATLMTLSRGLNAAGRYTLELNNTAVSDPASFYIHAKDYLGGTDFCVTSQGNVGIGTTSPERVLHAVSGQQVVAVFESLSATAGRLGVMDSATTGSDYVGIGADGDDLKLYAGGANPVTITTTNVGIGVTAPGLPLEIKKNGAGETTLVRLRSDDGADQGFLDIAVNATNNETVYKSTGSARGQHVFSDGLSERMRIDSSGLVGIGTSSPSSLWSQAYQLVVGGGGGNIGMSIYGAAAGNSRIAFVDTTAGTPGLDSGGLITYSHVNDAFDFRVAGSDAMHITSAGNVGIGTSSPKTIINASTSTGAILTLESSDTSLTTNDVIGGIDFYANDGSTNGTGAKVNIRGIATSTAGTITALTFGTSDSSSATATERMRIDGSGNLLVGTTSAPESSGGGAGFVASTSSRRILQLATTSTSSNTLQTFNNPNGTVGSVVTSGSATSFNTSSDQRLKENIVDAPSASDDIDAIQVRSFDWKVDGSHQRYGMVAQELLEVAPEAVSQGETEDDMMGVDYSKLVPMLVKEIQSLRARVAQLEGA